MAVVVQKYGGSSVADPERIRGVARRIVATRQLGHDVVVAVSAMGKTTDGLLELARKVSPEPGRRELDMLLSVGERISMSLLAMAINDLGYEAISFTGSQSGIITDSSHVNARIVEVRPVRILEALAQGKIVIVAGYQGVSRAREITTLGRGGTDTTAIALTAALGAEYCEICSDVDGVYSSDPREVPEARRISELSYDEMLELAVAGARVLNAEAVAYARENGIVIHAAATFSDTGFTRVAPQEPTRSGAVAVTVDRTLVGFCLSGEPARTSEGLEFLRSQRIPVRFVETRLHGELPRFCAWFRRILVPDLGRIEALARARWGGAFLLEQTLGSVTVVGAGLMEQCAEQEDVLHGLGSLRTSVAGAFQTPFGVTILLPLEWVGEAQQRLHALLVERPRAILPSR